MVAKVINLKSPFHLLMNACTVKRAVTLHISGQDVEALLERLCRVSVDVNSVQY